MSTIVSSQSFAHRQLLRRIRHSRTLIEYYAWEADHKDAHRAHFDKEIEELNAKLATLVDPQRPQAALHGLLLSVLLAVFIIDILLFGPVAEYFSMRNFGNDFTLDVIARVGLPLAILLLDLYLTAQTHVAEESAEDGLASWARYRFWAAASFLFALVLPAGVLATFLTSASDLPVWVDGALLFMLAILASMGHLAILFARRPLFEALELAKDRLFLWHLWRARNSVDAGARHQRLLVANNFRAYSGDLHTHSHLFPNFPLHVEPFDEITARVLREIYGEASFVGRNGKTVHPISAHCG